MAKTYRCSLNVRGYELDSFGHVNHGVYVNYLEHARWKMLEEESITLESFKQWQRWPVIAHLSLDYLKPVFMGEKLDIETKLVELSKTSFRFSQIITRSGTPVLRADVQAVMVNEKGRPASVPEEIINLSKKEIDSCSP